jgi:16S rRNA (guanine966-N2)-methyltransferase
LRIIAGRWAGWSLASPSGRVRPTSEELRGLWLGAVESDLKDARVLELFAGSGALALEALSRGARSADFVENGAPALHALKANIARVRARTSTRVFVKDALSFLAGLDADAYDVAFADPPYTSSLAERVVERWLEVPFARVLGVEHAADRKLPGRGVTHRIEDAAVTIYRRRPGGERRGKPSRSGRARGA